MSTQISLSSDLMTGLYPCTNLACVDVYGPDASTFLQSQLTHDLNLISQGRAALAGYCSAQGRLLASMIMSPTEQADRIRLILRTDLVEGLVKRLRMFVLRSKVTIEPQVQLQVFGLALPVSSLPAELCPEDVWSTQLNGSQLWIRGPSAAPSLARAWIITEATDTPSIASAPFRTDTEIWDAADILAGVPWIQEATRDLLIPQTINLDLIDGVSFTKGCYPGQEVVARAHYRTKVKRRMHAATLVPAQTQVIAGVDVHPAESSDEPCGRIIQVAHTQDASYVLFEAPDKYIAEGPLGVVGATTSLQLQTLPYSTTAV